MQINEAKHYNQPWISHDLLKDFEVEDVWQFPVELQKSHSLEVFKEEMMTGLEELQEQGLPGLLFKIRFFIGKIFNWDSEKELKEHPPMLPGSLRERFAKRNNLTVRDLPAPGNADFIPVYASEQESLAEIKNATVHAGLHLGKVKGEDGKYTIQMAIYVKPNGLLGKFYMALIKPFRHAIVYPALMRSVNKRWQKYLASETVV